MANNDDKIWNRSLDDIMSESFGKYAKYIIQDRALPDVRDGLKPVQRRILYAMNELKIHYDKPYKKSARTVGEVIGKYHPHGDSSIYEAMVRMSQEWKNNLPLLDMQGNKGSIDGDSPAAMRYTECRLSKFGQTLLKDIDKNTVKFINNFDDSEEEPTVLPSLLPNILINGATGIAAGYATNIPPFNPGEIIDGTIYRILNPNCSLHQITKIIKGPDFPTGGIIQSEAFDEIYQTGRGKFFIRARIEEEPIRSTKNIKRLIVREIPYDTNKSVIVRSLDEIKINNELPGFKEVRDDSDKDGIAIVLEFETEKDLEIIKTFLFKKTQLQISYNANLVLIKDRKPVQAGLLEILDAFIDHAHATVIKAAQFDLEKSLARKEIIEGLIKAISDIDVLVNLIKSSTSKETAKVKIQEYFAVNEKQSEAIVNLRLYVLTSYDTEKLKKEYEDLLEFIKEKELIINSNHYRNKYLVSILKDYKKGFDYKRRTTIENEIADLEIETTDIIEEIHGTCIVTRDNYIKYIDDDSILEFDLLKTKIKDADIPIDIFKMSTLDYLVCLTNRGKVITIPAYKIKMTKLKDNGIHINELVTIDSYEKTILAFAVSKYSNTNTQILVATKNSLIKRLSLSDLSLSKTAKYLRYISFKSNGDDVVSASVLKEEFQEVITVTENGFATRYNLAEIPIVGRSAAGVRNMNLKENDAIAFTVPIPQSENFLFFIANRGAKRIHINDIISTSRSKLGKRIFQQIESNPYLINSGFMVSGRSTVYLLLESNQLIDLKVAEIPISDNETRMNIITKIDKVNILKGSCLVIDKSRIAASQTDNFITLSEEKVAKLENKDQTIDDSDQDSENEFLNENANLNQFDKLQSFFKNENNVKELKDSHKTNFEKEEDQQIQDKQSENNQFISPFEDSNQSEIGSIEESDSNLDENHKIHTNENNQTQQDDLYKQIPEETHQNYDPQSEEKTFTSSFISDNNEEAYQGPDQVDTKKMVNFENNYESQNELENSLDDNQSSQAISTENPENSINNQNTSSSQNIGEQNENNLNEESSNNEDYNYEDNSFSINDINDIEEDDDDDDW